VADAVKIRIQADAGQAKKEIASLGGSFGGLSKTTIAAGGAIVAVLSAVVDGAKAAAVGLVENAAAVAKMGDEIAKTARIVGVSGEQFQVLAFAAERSGVSMSSVESGMKRLARSMFDAQHGSKQVKDTFKGMGIAFEDANGKLRPSIDVLRDVADRMRTVGVTSQTTAEAQVILGRSGADLTNLLIAGSAGLDNYETKLRSLNGVMSEETLAASEAYEDSLTNLKTAVMGLRREMGAPLIEVMTEFNDKATEGATGMSNLASGIGEVSAAVFKFVAIDFAAQAIEDIFGDDPNLSGQKEVNDKRLRMMEQHKRELLRSSEGLTGFFGGNAPAANSAPAAAVATGPGKVSPAVEAAVYDQNAMMIDITAVLKTADAIQTQNHMDELAERFMWDHDYEMKAVALRKESLDQIAAWEEQAANDRYDAAAASFGAIQQFAGIAQEAVEDSYFGQTQAGKKAAMAMFIAGKAAALGMAIVNTAQGVSAAIASAPAPYNIPAIVAAGVGGAAAIGTIVATTIQGIADAGLPPGALRQAGLNNHTAIAIRNDEMVIDPKGTSEITKMLNLQRRQMEMGAMTSANAAPAAAPIYLDGRRVTEGLRPHMTADLEGGNDFRRNVRVAGAR